jgi:hypothetical protein
VYTIIISSSAAEMSRWISLCGSSKPWLTGFITRLVRTWDRAPGEQWIFIFIFRGSFMAGCFTRPAIQKIKGLDGPVKSPENGIIATQKKINH